VIDRNGGTMALVRQPFRVDMGRSAARFFLAMFLALAALGASAAMPDFHQLEKRLKIRPEQKEQFDLAAVATKRALLMVGLTAVQVKDRLTAELLKDNPDFLAFVRDQQVILEQSRPQLKEAGEEWRKLYAILDHEQVEIAKAFVRENFDRLLQLQ
jgi:hypothetical protein